MPDPISYNILHPVPIPQERSWELNFPNLLQIFHYSFQSIDEANGLAQYLSSFYPFDKRTGVELGLNELFLNAVEHGNLGISQEEKILLRKSNLWHKEIHERLNSPHNRYKEVVVMLDITPDYITLQIKDQGQGFNWQKIQNSPPASSDNHSGRGLLICRQMSFDRIEFLGRGNWIKCWVYLGSAIL